MKICVLSDSHGAKDKVANLLKEKYFDLVIFLGDGVRDFSNIDNQNLKLICGNCDLFCDEALEQTFSIYPFKFLITHGHKYKVKLGLYSLLKRAQEEKAHIVLYGHTHEQNKEIIEGITFINPGSLRNGDYAEIVIQNDKFEVNFIQDYL